MIDFYLHSALFGLSWGQDSLESKILTYIDTLLPEITISKMTLSQTVSDTGPLCHHKNKRHSLPWDVRTAATSALVHLSTTATTSLIHQADVLAAAQVDKTRKLEAKSVSFFCCPSTLGR